MPPFYWCRNTVLLFSRILLSQCWSLWGIYAAFVWRIVRVARFCRQFMGQKVKWWWSLPCLWCFYTYNKGISWCFAAFITSVMSERELDGFKADFHWATDYWFIHDEFPPLDLMNIGKEHEMSSCCKNSDTLSETKIGLKFNIRQLRLSFNCPNRPYHGFGSHLDR